MSEVFFYSLYSSSRTPGGPDKDWLAAYRRTSCCPECTHPLSTVGAVDTCLTHPPDKAALNFVQGAVLSYAHVAFLDALGILGIQDFYFGDVAVNNVGVLPDYKTYRGRKVLTMYGKQNPEEGRHCQTCGRWMYFPRYPRFLFDSDLTGASVYEGNVPGIIVSPGVYNLVMQRRWSKVGHYKLPVIHKV